MLYNIDRGIGVLLIPKTGSKAIQRLLVKKVHLDYNVHTHKTMAKFKEQLASDGISDAPFNSLFGVYRDPIDRFISGVNYFKYYWARYPAAVLEYLGYEIDFFDLVQPGKDLTDVIDKVPITTIVESLKAIESSEHEDKKARYLPIWLPQREYLDHPGVELLDFKDLLGSVNKILAAFDVEPVSDLPRVNETQDKIRTRDSLTAQDIAAIKDYYSTDYEFFEKKGIFFEV